MSSKPLALTRMAALLPVSAVVLLSTVLVCMVTAPTPPKRIITSTPAFLNSTCPPSPIRGCECYDYHSGPNIRIREGGSIDTCMANLSASGHTTLYELVVEFHPAFNLTKDIFKDVMFRWLKIYGSTIQRVDENFLGRSINFTTNMEFYNSLLLEGIPKINAGVLSVWEMQYVSYGPNINPTLRKNIFSGTPALETLTIGTADPSVTTVQRHVFRSLHKLRGVSFEGSVHFRWGGGHFASPDLTTLEFGWPDADTFEADPGSFSGIPAGVTLRIMGGQFIGGWSASKFFNILRGGADIYAWDAQECDCSLAWIRYSSFLKQVTIDCRQNGATPIPLAKFNLSHCKFYREQSLHRTEL